MLYGGNEDWGDFGIEKLRVMLYVYKVIEGNIFWILMW